LLSVQRSGSEYKMLNCDFGSSSKVLQVQQATVCDTCEHLKNFSATCSLSQIS